MCVCIPIFGVTTQRRGLSAHAGNKSKLTFSWNFKQYMRNCCNYFKRLYAQNDICFLNSAKKQKHSWAPCCKQSHYFTNTTLNNITLENLKLNQCRSGLYHCVPLPLQLNRASLLYNQPAHQPIRKAYRSLFVHPAVQKYALQLRGEHRESNLNPIKRAI